MANVKVFDMAGKEVGTVELSDNVFGITPNETVVHAAVRAYLLNQRQGTQSTLTRAEVSGGGRKPWRQKGTGRARQGSTRAPQWTHGGVAMGPKPRKYHIELNKKVKRLALTSALSSKLLDSSLIVVDEIKSAEYKTKTMVNMLKAVGAAKKALVVLDLDTVDETTVKSFNNIEGVKTAYFNTINVYDILNCDSLVLCKAAANRISEVYA